MKSNPKKTVMNKPVTTHFSIFAKLDVKTSSSWTTIQEVVDFLELIMTGPAVIRLEEAAYNISATINIHLPYSITLQGMSYGTAAIATATGLTGKPVFKCLSKSYFKMLNFDATTLKQRGKMPSFFSVAEHTMK